MSCSLSTIFERLLMGEKARDYLIPWNARTPAAYESSSKVAYLEPSWELQLAHSSDVRFEREGCCLFTVVC